MDEKSVFVGVFTTNSGAWPGGEGTVFPAVALAAKDIELALLEADMEILVQVPIGVDLPAGVKVRPDEDMLLVIARPRVIATK
jgi:hypothetical protein